MKVISFYSFKYFLVFNIIKTVNYDHSVKKYLDHNEKNSPETPGLFLNTINGFSPQVSRVRLQKHNQT